jgi:hypothetical protein
MSIRSVWVLTTVTIQVRASLKSTDGITIFVDTVNSGSPTRIEEKGSRSEADITTVRCGFESFGLGHGLVPENQDAGRTNAPGTVRST